MKTITAFLAALATTAVAQTIKLEPPKSQSSIQAFAFSPDGARVAGGAGVVGMTVNGRKQSSSGGEVLLWDAKTGKIQRTLGRHEASLVWLAWSGDGGLLASGSDDDGVVKIWDARAGTTRVTLKAGGPLAKAGMHGGALCAFSADSRALATVAEKRSKVGDTEVRTGDTLTLWELATGKARWQVPDSHVAALALSPDGKVLAAVTVKEEWKAMVGGGASSSQSDPQFVAWETPTGKELWRVAAKGFAPETLAFLPDGRLLAVKDGEFTPIDAATGAPGATVKSKEFGRTLKGLVFSADGARFVATDFVGSEISWGETATGVVSATQRLTSGLHDLAFSRDLKLAAGTVGFDPVVLVLAPAAK